MKSGKPHVTVAVGPPGASISFEVEIDPSALGIWVTQFQRMLRAVKYQKIEPIADKESFQFMTDLSQAMICTQLDIGRFLAYGKDKLDAVLSFFGKSRRAGMVAYIFDTSDQKVLQEWVTLLPPEALGPLLDTVISEPKKFQVFDPKSREMRRVSRVEVHAWQQMVVGKIVNWLWKDTNGLCFGLNYSNKVHASQRQLEEAITRMNSDSRASSDYAQRLISFNVNKSRLISFMSDKPEFEESGKIGFRLEIEHGEHTNNFSKQINQLLMHVELDSEAKENLTKSSLSYYASTGKTVPL